MKHLWFQFSDLCYSVELWFCSPRTSPGSGQMGGRLQHTPASPLGPVTLLCYPGAGFWEDASRAGSQFVCEGEHGCGHLLLCFLPAFPGEQEQLVASRQGFPGSLGSWSWCLLFVWPAFLVGRQDAGFLVFPHVSGWVGLGHLTLFLPVAPLWSKEVQRGSLFPECKRDCKIIRLSRCHRNRVDNWMGSLSSMKYLGLYTASWQSMFKKHPVRASGCVEIMVLGTGSSKGIL